MAKKKASKKKPSSMAKSVDTKRGKVYERNLKFPITFNDEEFTKAEIELDHINYGLDDKGELKTKKRLNFNLNDVEQFLREIDDEVIDEADETYGDVEKYILKVDSPIKSKFHKKPFWLIISINKKKIKTIRTITIYPAW